MSDQDEPKLGCASVRFSGQYLLEAREIVCLSVRLETQGNATTVGAGAGGLPEVGLVKKIAAEFRFTWSTDNDDDGGGV